MATTVSFSLSTNRTRVLVRSPYDPDLVDVFRQTGGRWDKSGRVWTYHPVQAAGLIAMLENQRALEVEVGAEVREAIEATKELERLAEAREDESNEDLALPAELYPFQRAGVRFGLKTGGRCIIADEQGLGKTVQALMILKHFNPSRTLIVAPASVLENWKREVRLWLDKEACIFVPRKGELKPDASIVITSYDGLKKIEYQPEMLILDESHYIKNHKAQRTVTALEKASRCKWVLALTGTPLLNRPAELWTSWQAVQPSTCPGWWAYARRYCAAYETRYGWDVSGASHTDELQKMLHTFMLRRKKSEVLQELPPITRRVVPLRPDAPSPFLGKLREIAKSGKRINPELRMSLMQDALQEFHHNAEIKSKIPEFADYITNALEQQNGDKLVIFAKHIILIKAITDILRSGGVGHVVITGETKVEERQALVDKFIADKNCRVAVLSLGVGREGLNLQAASRAIITELDWSPSALAQAEARLHRIGQQGNVEITYIVYGQFEDRLYALLAQKSELIAKIVDNQTDENENGKGGFDMLTALISDK